MTKRVKELYKKHKDRGDVFVQYSHIWKELSFFGKFIEVLDWTWAFIQVFGIIIVILLIVGAAMGAFGAIFGV